MKDIYFDEEFKALFDNDLIFISDIEVQYQRLYKFFLIKKGELFWDKDFGFDSSLFFKYLKLGSIEGFKNYLIVVALELNLDIVDIEVSFSNNIFNITYYFVGNSELTIKHYI